MTNNTTDLPPAIRKNWDEFVHDKTRAITLETQLPALDAKITQAQEDVEKAQNHLRLLNQQHADKGREITGFRTSSEQHRELVELWCAKHGHTLPPEPKDVLLNVTAELPPEQVDVFNGNAAAAAPPVTPCFQDPPQHGDCGSPVCTCPHHQAENDALTDEQNRVHNILGTGPIGIGVAGHTTQITRNDTSEHPAIGGEGPGNGRFPGDPDA
ncbi:hypothetical protein BJF79_13475 [Actinomadura sp. CNU-125]|uniref:hypothetical protein n=1 Tax=Actinomadura sp. CNU-125 TaxID=1904961 RepID=UPI0009632C53|nr:hypothetical protein [Actinomadura sp. CNU-125]OLT24349.1 hypothetical protein BJF79_13475 [Actinomadura sp. CNU-125]